MAAPNTYTQFLQQLPISWLVGGPVGQANATALGGVLDTQVDYLKQAIKARFPNYAPSDALPYKGHERGLIQGPSESNAAFATRLQFAWEQWQFAGSALGVLVQLYFQGYTSNVVIAQQNGLAFSLTGTLPAFVEGVAWDPTSNLVFTALQTNPTITGHPPFWFFDLNYAFASRYVVLFVNPLPASWTNVVNPPTPTTAPTISQVNTISSIISTWGPARTCDGIYAQVSGSMLGWPTTKTLGSGTLGGSVVVWPVD